jgi:multidrug transporter EmrE-like cation transporter
MEHPMTSYIFLAVAIVSEVIATAALKSSNGFTQIVPSIVVVAGYASAFFFLSLTLNTIPVGIAYATWSGVGIILISVVGWLVLGQKLDLAGMVGIGFILVGVLIVNLLSNSGAH